MTSIGIPALFNMPLLPCPICGTYTRHCLCSEDCAARFFGLPDSDREALKRPGTVLDPSAHKVTEVTILRELVGDRRLSLETARRRFAEQQRQFWTTDNRFFLIEDEPNSGRPFTVRAAGSCDHCERYAREGWYIVEVKVPISPRGDHAACPSA